MDKYLAFLLAAMFLIKALVFGRTYYALEALLAVAPLASFLDYFLDIRLLKHKNSRWTSLLLENAIAILAFLMMWDIFALSILWLPSLGEIVLILCGYKALIVGLTMILRGLRSPIPQLVSFSNAFSLALRTLTIGFAASAYIVES